METDGLKGTIGWRTKGAAIGREGLAQLLNEIPVSFSCLALYSFPRGLVLDLGCDRLSCVHTRSRIADRAHVETSAAHDCGASPHLVR